MRGGRYHQICVRNAAKVASARAAANIPRPSPGRVHIYFVSCALLPKPLSSRWSRIKGSAGWAHRGARARTSANSVDPHQQKGRSDGLKHPWNSAKLSLWHADVRTVLPHIRKKKKTAQRLHLDVRQREERSWVVELAPLYSRMGVWLLYFHEAWWCCFPFLNILIPVFNALWKIGSSEYALVRQYDEREWYKMPHIAKKEKTKKTAVESFSTLKTDTRRRRCAPFFTVYVQGLFVF